MTEPIRIGVMSDLHLEFEAAWWERHIAGGAARGDSSMIAAALLLRRELRAEPGHPGYGPDLRGLKAARIDLLLMPGDIDTGVGGVRYAAAAAEYVGAPSIVVAGNHESYGYDLVELTRTQRQEALKSSATIFLEMGRADLEVRGRRVAVLGATLWTDYLLTGNRLAAMARAEDDLNDHLLIRYGGRRLRPADALAIHQATREWLSREIPRARTEADLVIVMTHHAPLADANPPEHRGGRLSPAFASDLTAEILAWQPDLWSWGHTHHSMTTRLGRTRLVSCQRGYLGIESSAETFTPLVIEVDRGHAENTTSGEA